MTLSIAVVDDLYQRIEHLDATSPRQACRFDDPDVVVTVESVLYILLFECL